MSPDVSLIIPCYYEESHLLESVNVIIDLLTKTKYFFELILVDDCSSDKTPDIIHSLSEHHTNIRYLIHKENTGRGGAFMDGIPLAVGKYIGFLDIDLEVSCVYLLSVLQELEKGNDVVVVKRHYALLPDPVFIFRHILSIGYKFLVHRFLKIPHIDTESGFKFFKRDCLLHLAAMVQNKHWFFDTEIITLAYKNGYKIKEVDGLFLRRKDKKSTVRLFTDTLLYIKELIRFKKRIRS